MATRIKTAWYRTGECRVIPSWFGFMRAEFIYRRDFKDPESGEVMEYQMRPRGTGHLPPDMDGPGAFGFWSTMATPDDKRYGDRAIWRKLISFFNAPKVANTTTDGRMT